MLLTGHWHDALGEGQDIVVIALDIEGPLDKVWHQGLLEKLFAKGMQVAHIYTHNLLAQHALSSMMFNIAGSIIV